MGYALWVMTYEVTRFPKDRRLSYHVFQCRHQVECPGACRHEIDAEPLARAKWDAVVLHERTCVKDR
jgi:hypothetical protein